MKKEKLVTLIEQHRELFKNCGVLKSTLDKLVKLVARCNVQHDLNSMTHWWRTMVKLIEDREVTWTSMPESAWLSYELNEMTDLPEYQLLLKKAKKIKDHFKVLPELRYEPEDEGEGKPRRKGKGRNKGLPDAPGMVR